MLDIRTFNGANEQRVPAETTTRPDLKARHQRFLKNRQNGRGKRDDGEDDDDDDDKTKTSSTSSSTRTNTESSSLTSLASSATSIVAITASSTQVSTTQSAFSSPTIVRPTTSTIGVTSTATTAETIQFTAAPEVLSSSTFITSAKGTVVVGTKPSKSTATGLGNANSLVKTTHNHLAPGVVIVIVFLAMGIVLAVAFTGWYFIQKKRKTASSEDFSFRNEEKPSTFRVLGSIRRKRPPPRESIWGGSTTGTRTEAGDIPPSVPAFMQAGGHDQVNSSESTYVQQRLILPQELRTENEGMPEIPPVAPNMGKVGTDGLLRPPSRWLKRDSIVSVPRFKDVKSWAKDQTGRTNKSSDEGGVSETPAGSYEQM